MSNAYDSDSDSENSAVLSESLSFTRRNFPHSLFVKMSDDSDSDYENPADANPATESSVASAIATTEGVDEIDGRTDVQVTESETEDIAWDEKMAPEQLFTAEYQFSITPKKYVDEQVEKLVEEGIKKLFEEDKKRIAKEEAKKQRKLLFCREPQLEGNISGEVEFSGFDRYVFKKQKLPKLEGAAPFNYADVWGFFPYLGQPNPINYYGARDGSVRENRSFRAGRLRFKPTVKLANNFIAWTKELMSFLERATKHPLSFQQIQQILLENMTDEEQKVKVRNGDVRKALQMYQTFFYSIEERGRDFRASFRNVKECVKYARPYFARGASMASTFGGRALLGAYTLSKKKFAAVRRKDSLYLRSEFPGCIFLGYNEKYGYDCFIDILERVEQTSNKDLSRARFVYY